MVVINSRIAKLLRQAAGGHSAFTPVSLFIADAILRTWSDPLPIWDAWLVGLQRADRTDAIAANRELIKSGHVDKTAWSFEMESDAWQAYCALERSGRIQGPQRSAVAELLDPYEVCDLGDLVSCWPLERSIVIPSDTEHVVVDLVAIGVIKHS
jgi:hypothetical protein